MVLRIFFLFISNTIIKFAELRKFIERFYDTIEVLSTTNKIELIDKRKFAKVILNNNFKIFVIYVATLIMMPIYLFSTVQVYDKSILAIL